MPKKRSSRGFPVPYQALKRVTAASLALSLAGFACPMPAQARDSGSAGRPASPGASAGVLPGGGMPPRSVAVPAPSLEQSARARKLFQDGAAALKQRESPRAVQLLGEAHRLAPANASFLAAYEIARQQQVGGLLQAERQDRRAGNWSSAKKRLRAAMHLDPGNPYVEQDIQSLARESEPAVVSSMPMPRFSSGLVELAPSGVRAAFHLRASARQVVRRVLQAYGVKALLDDSVPTKQVRLDLDGANFAEASKALRLATNTFIVPLDSKHALVAKDTKENRAKFERLLMETVYLQGMDSKQMSSILKLIQSVFGVKQISMRPDTGMMTIRAPESMLHAINATLVGLCRPQPQVVLDVRIYQIGRTRRQKLGVSFPQTVSIFNVSSELSSIIAQNQSTVDKLIASGLVNPGDLAGIAALLAGLGLLQGSVFNQPFALFGGGLTLSGLSIPGASVNASLNLSKTRELDHVELRAGEGGKQSFLVGSRYPVVTQSYTAGTQIPTSSASIASLISGSGRASSPAVNPLSYAPTVQYIDLGLTVKAVAHIVEGNDVRIHLQVKLASLSGSSLNQSPIIDNRSFTTEIQAPNGGSALIASDISKSESHALSGIPGLSALPGFSWTASPSKKLSAGKLLLVISPHIVSATHPRVASAMIPVEQVSTK